MTDDMDLGDRSRRGRDRDRHSGLVGGLVLITIGAIFLVDQMGWAPGFRFHHLWPLILIVIGLANLFTGRRRGWGGGWLVLVGTMFLLHENRVLVLGRTWPLFIVAAGLGLMFGGYRGRRRDDSGGPHV